MRVSVWHDGSMIGRDLTSSTARYRDAPCSHSYSSMRLALDCFAALGRVGEVALRASR
jgi:hypothetical protein